MTSHSAGDTVKSTNSTNSTTNGECSVRTIGRDPRLQSTRKRRRVDPSTTATDIPQKTPRRNDDEDDDDIDDDLVDNAGLPINVDPASRVLHVKCDKRNDAKKFTGDEVIRSCDARDFAASSKKISKRLQERQEERGDWQDKTQTENDVFIASLKRKKQEQEASTRRLVLSSGNVKDESTRLRKTIQWLEEGARRLREDLANARTELHEERRAAKLVKREIEAAIREAKATEAAKYQLIISELKSRLSRSGSAESNCASPSPLSSSSSSSLKVDLMKDENHRREISAMKKRLAESENTIRRLKMETLNLQGKSAPCRLDGSSCAEVRRLQAEIHALRTNNEKLEAKLRIAIDAEKARTAELRIQHENHEAELTALRKSLRSETIKMMDEMRGKSREIEKLSKLLIQGENSRKRRKTASKDDSMMRKLQDSERNGPIRSTPRGEKKFIAEDHTLESYIREVGCDRAIAEIEVERLRELALEQQEVIEILRQTVKEKERKLEQLSNKKRKEEFYRQWLELEPVAEVDDEEDHEEGDSALSSAPSSLSPQPGGCGQWQSSGGVTREAYEAVLIEIEELQSKLLDERQELARARIEVRDLEKALLQETRCSNQNKQLEELSEKLRSAEEREANLLVELSELREQNELLEFRLLELEESPARRESPDHTADSGIVSPELLHPSKDQGNNKQRNRAVATVIPYTNSNNYNTTTRAVSPVPRKPPLSLQESGIFEEEDEEESEIELASRGTQTETPSGELLQEVQRLQELRARIQERAAKVTNPAICSIDSAKVCPPLDGDVDSIVQLSSYQERIRDLEERLEVYEETEEKRVEERRVTKQREEELLDENYRLTERVYWLENKLRNVEELIENRSRSGSSDRLRVDPDDQENNLENDRCDCGLRGFKNKMDVLGVVEAEMNEVNKGGNRIEEMEEVLKRTKAVQTSIELVDFSPSDCPRCRVREMSKGSEQANERWIAPETCRVMVEVVQNCREAVEEVAKEAKEEENGVDEADGASKNKNDDGVVKRRISQVLVTAKEEEEEKEDEEEEEKENRTENESNSPLVTINNESESEKKVRQRQSKANRRERRDYSRTSKEKGSARLERVRRDAYYERRHHRLVLYQEICV